MVNLTPRALQYLDRQGILKAKLTVSNRRFYTDEDMLIYFGYLAAK